MGADGLSRVVLLGQRSDEVALLRRAAERAVDLRKQWEKSAAISDPKQRVAALWPFLALHTYGVRNIGDNLLNPKTPNHSSIGPFQTILNSISLIRFVRGRFSLRVHLQRQSRQVEPSVPIRPLQEVSA